MDAASTPAGLRERTLSAVRWVAAARVGAEIIGFAGVVVTARLIAPAGFGHAAIALLIAPVASVLVGAVASTLLVRHPRLTGAHREAGAFVALLAGALLTLLALAFGRWAAPHLFDAETARLVQIASPIALLVALITGPDALLRRDLGFRLLSVLEVGALLAGGTTTIVAALAGAGPLALVLGAYAGLATTLVGLVRRGRWARPRWHGREGREILRVGGDVGVGSLANLIYRNVDYVLVGAFLGPAALGLYWRAYQLGVEYQNKIGVVMLRVALPVFSRAEDEGTMRRVRRRVVRLHAALIVPLLVLLAVSAPVLVPFVFGDAWAGAITPIRILAVVGICAALMNGVGPYLTALGRTRPLAVFNWAAVAIYAVTVALAAPHGLTTLCLAAAAVAVAGFLIGHAVLMRPVGIGFRELGQDAGPALAAAAAAAVPALACVDLLPAAGAPAALTLLASLGLGTGLYALTLRRLSKQAWSDVVLVLAPLTRRLPRRGRALAEQPALA